MKEKIIKEVDLDHNQIKEIIRIHLKEKKVLKRAHLKIVNWIKYRYKKRLYYWKNLRIEDNWYRKRHKNKI